MSNGVGRPRRLLVVIAAIAALLLVAGGIAWFALRDDDGTATGGVAKPTPADGEVVEGPVTVRYPAEAFPDGGTPTVDLIAAGDDDFLGTFAVPGVEPVIADVTAPDQPSTSVQVAFDFNPSALPDDAVPVIFYYASDLDLWLPIPTVVDEETGQLVGTTDHFTWFTTALTTVINGAEAGAQWLRYQTARAVGARAGQPGCGSTAPPRWVVREDKDQGLNDPLPICLTTAGDGQLELHVVVNRGYSMALSGPVTPTSVDYVSLGNTSDVLYQTLAEQVDVVGAGQVFLPARVETVLTYPEGSFPSGQVRLIGNPTPAAAVMDVVVAAGEFLLGKIPSAVTTLIGMVNCAADAISASTSDAARMVGAAAAAVQSCAEPVLLAAGAAGSALVGKLTLGLQAGLLAGRAAQTAVDAAMAWQEPADVVLRVQEPGPAIPAGAVLLSSVLSGSGGVGPSGAAIDVPLGNVDVPQSTSQWVGCEGAAAWGEYDLDGRTRLTALLGLRDFTPLELVVQIRVLVDGTLVQTYTVDGPAIPVDLRLPAGSLLRLEATKTAGTCTSAPEGYGVWGNGALS